MRPANEVVIRTTGARRAKPKGSQAGWLALLAVFVFVAGVSLLVSSSGNGSRSQPVDDNDTAILAHAMAKQFVENNLKAPATADFPRQATSIYQDHQGRWVVTSYVDAQNSFGANVRTHWKCVLHHTGGGNWRLDELEM